MLWVLSRAVLFKAGMNHRKGLLSPLAAVISSHAQLPCMPAPTGNKAPVLVSFWSGKVQAAFPIKQSPPSVPEWPALFLSPVGFPSPQTISPFPENFLSLWASFSWNQLTFPDSCSHLLSCFLIPTLNPCPACLLTSDWNVGRGYPGSALMFCGCDVQHW